MAHAIDINTLMANKQHDNNFFLIALLLSIALHSTAIGFLPGFSFSSTPITPPLTVELVTPEPPPVKKPEPPKSEPEKPKPIQTPKPIPHPVQKPVTPEPPPLAPAPKVEKPAPIPETPKPVVTETRPVLAMEQKVSEPPPTFTTPTAPPVTQKEPIINEDAEDDTDGYGRAMAGEFQKNVKYPQIALMKRWEGIVKVTLHIDAEGNVTDVTIKSSSGKDALDEAALKTARKTKLLPIPPSRRGKTFMMTVPINYHMDK